MSDDTPETLRGALTQLCKRWSLLTIRVDVPENLQKDAVREALDMLTKADAAALTVVHEDSPQAQRMIICCLREVYQLVSANIS